jgi:hypothetical protein
MGILVHSAKVGDAHPTARPAATLCLPKTWNFPDVEEMNRTVENHRLRRRKDFKTRLGSLATTSSRELFRKLHQTAVHGCPF